MKSSSRITDVRRPRAAVLLFAGLCITTMQAPLAKQARPLAATQVTSETWAPAPADLERIKELLRRSPGITLDDRQLRFYMVIVAETPKFTDWIGDSQHRIEGSATHREFLQMVTPRLINSSAGITPREWMEFCLTNLAAEAAVKRAVQDIRKARSDAEVREIRDRISRELLVLKGGG